MKLRNRSTSVIYTDLSLLAVGIKRAFEKRGHYFRISTPSRNKLLISDIDTGEVVEIYVANLEETMPKDKTSNLYFSLDSFIKFESKLRGEPECWIDTDGGRSLQSSLDIWIYRCLGKNEKELRSIGIYTKNEWLKKAENKQELSEIIKRDVQILSSYI